MAALAAAGVMAYASAAMSQEAPVPAPTPVPLPPQPMTQQPVAPPPPAPPGYPPPYPPPPPYYYPPEQPLYPVSVFAPRTGIGMALLLGGGVSDFVNTTPERFTGTAGSWNVRGIIGTRRIVAIEGSYVGAAQSISGLGLNGSNTLIRNGLEGVLRIQAPIPTVMGMVEPYAFGGAGWNHYSFATTPVATASVSAHDDVATFPFGMGLMGSYKGLLGDLRVTYRPTVDSNLFGTAANTGLSSWEAGGAIGYEF
jgi:hypothetical protein